MFRELKLNEEKILSLKKAKVLKSAEKGQIGLANAYLKPEFAAKMKLDEGFVYPVINTTKYMDSHDDVHFDGLWNKTLKEQQGKIFYLSNHSMTIDDVVAWPEDVEAFTSMIDWSLVGKDYPGQTEALIYKIPESKIMKPAALDAIKQRRKVQGSVSMMYVKIKLAMNSDDKEHAENKTFWNSHIEEIANREDVEKQGFFFGVSEAKIYKEGSLVLFGSNDATEIIYPKDEPLDESTHDTEPSADTLKAIDYEYLIKNLLK